MIASPLKEDISTVILAGGRGRRVDELDKGLINFSGKTLVEHVLERVAGQTVETLIVANRHIDEYAALGVNVISDRIDGYQGPLAGIDVAFSVTASSFLLCVPCDSPFLPDDLIDRFIVASTGNNPIVVASDGQRLHPIICLIHRSVWPDVERRLAQGHLRLMDWVDANGYDVADFSDCPVSLQNLNTLAQIHAAKQS